MRTHTGAKLQHVWQHVCSECGKGFHQASSLQLHGLTHTAQMDHVCLDCGNAYSKESSLRAHLLTHPAAGLQAASTAEAVGKQINTSTHAHNVDYQCSTVQYDNTPTHPHTVDYKCTTVEYYKCRLCVRGFLHRQDLVDHVDHHIAASK